MWRTVNESLETTDYTLLYRDWFSVVVIVRTAFNAAIWYLTVKTVQVIYVLVDFDRRFN